MRTTGNRWVSRIFIAALLLAVLCVGASDAAGRDPIGTRRIVPKSRLTVNATSNQTINTYNLMRATTFTGQDASEPTAKNVIELGAAGLSDWWAFAQASVAADIPGRDPISFLGGPNVTVDGGVCNAYFLYDPSNNDPNIIIYMELLDGEESLGKIELTHVPAPTYMITDYMRVGADISTTLVADDWSGDGFSDYILTYRVYSGRTAYGSNGFYYTDVQHVYVYIDGQSLYDAVTSYGESALIKKTVIQTPSSTNMTAAPTSQYNIPAVSTRTAIGDVDNDGVNEFVVHAANLNGDILRVYDVSADISGAAQLSQIGGDMTLYGSGGYTNYYNANVGVAVGDLDGDGYAEICTLHTYQETPPSNPANHSCYLMRHIWKYSGGSITHIGGFDLGAIMDVRTIHNRFSTGAWIALPPLEMAIADFNNDGRQDLAYMFWSLSDGPYLCIDTFNTSDSNWPNTNTATGHAFATGAGNNPHYSMAAGYFKPLDNETFTDKGAPKQLALVFYRNVNPYMLEWSLYDVDTNCNLRQIGSTISDPITTDTTDLVASFTVIAADTSNESLVIGNPIPVSVTSVTPLVVMQAPPRHRDIVSGDFSVNGANPPDANGNSYPDAFSTLLSYETQYSSTTSSQTVSSTTQDTRVSFGAAVDTKTSVGIPGIAEATVSAAAKYSNKQTESSTQ
ncbi:MAG: VCBS repeat-containing protein, partial [Synergistaceae bacterium]|nr:VCBS repeat-containing protein [Synergistaceae bacterium]